MPQTALITGGAGFIGSHLAEMLLGRGDAVVALDDLSTGRMANVQHLMGHPRFRLVEGSVLDEEFVDDAVRQSDVVVHLAAAVGVRLIVEQYLRSFTTNVRGSEIVIKASHRHRRKLLLASTSEIYGKNENVPLLEDADRILGSPTVARWAYSTAKAANEILAYGYHRERGLRCVVVRLFNTVGPRQSPDFGMVIPRLVRQALAGEPLTVFGDGSQTRCFGHVIDVADAIVRLLDVPDAVGEVFNVGSQEEISVLALAERVRDLTDSASEIECIPYERAYEVGFEDMPRRIPDIAKIADAVGWAPERSLDEIVQDVVAFQQAEAAVV